MEQGNILEIKGGTKKGEETKEGMGKKHDVIIRKQRSK